MTKEEITNKFNTALTFLQAAMKATGMQFIATKDKRFGLYDAESNTTYWLNEGEGLEMLSDMNKEVCKVNGFSYKAMR